MEALGFVALLGVLTGWRWAGWERAMAKTRDEAIVVNGQRVLMEMKRVLRERFLMKERLRLCDQRERVQQELTWFFSIDEQLLRVRHREAFHRCLLSIRARQQKAVVLAEMRWRHGLRQQHDRCAARAAWIARQCLDAREARALAIEATARNARLRMDTHTRRRNLMMEIRTCGQQRQQFREYLERMNRFHSMLEEIRYHPPRLRPMKKPASEVPICPWEMLFLFLMMGGFLMMDLLESLYLAIPELLPSRPLKRSRRGRHRPLAPLVSKHSGRRPSMKRNRYLTTRLS